jgi:hypothetical protein
MSLDPAGRPLHRAVGGAAPLGIELGLYLVVRGPRDGRFVLRVRELGRQPATVGANESGFVLLANLLAALSQPFFERRLILEPQLELAALVADLDLVDPLAFGAFRQLGPEHRNDLAQRGFVLRARGLPESHIVTRSHSAQPTG